jgi:hypothetical protein
MRNNAQCTEQPDNNVHFSGGDAEEEPRSLGPSTCADMPHFQELIVDPHTNLDHILPEDDEPVEEFVPLEAEPDKIVRLRYATTENVFLSVGINLYLVIVSQFSYYASVCCLVCRSAFQSKTISSNKVMKGSIPHDFVMLYLKISVLVALQGAREKELFAFVLQSFVTLIHKLSAFLPKDHPLEEKLEYINCIPTNTRSFVSQLEQPSNQNSLLSLLPTPGVLHVQEIEHSFCSLTELVSMAMFLPPTKKRLKHLKHQYHSLVLSTAYLEQRHRVPVQYRTQCETTNRRPTVLVYVVIWSDGWDPNRSNKGNRYPVWTATATLVCVELGQNDKPYMVITELLGTGLGKKSHKGYSNSCSEKRHAIGRIKLDSFVFSLSF